jgi:SagB-type dehydrogenase family enzyme
MPKLLWVALPLLLAATLIATQALRRRPPSRHALNIWFSVLLLAYVLTTAGLGIFWVANQQLPVFDWHYLFGYGTVLLVALHLTFNFRTVWRYLVRPGVAPAATMASAAPGRRSALGGLGLLAATGAAFALGLRHGRSELRVDSEAQGGADVPPDPAAAGLALVERFHAFSSHSRAGVLLRAPGVDWGDPPPAFKRYSGAPRLALPAPGATPGTPFDLAALGAALWHTSGVTASRGGLKLRASPSSGALFSTELYVASRAVRGLLPGLWHYDSQAHALERLQGVAPDDAALGATGEATLRDAAAVVIATAVFRRSGHKYRDRTYRYVLADLGHALENLRVAAGTAGAQARLVAGFDESRAAATLEVDEAEEGVLAMTALGVGLAPSRPSQPVPHWLGPGWPAKQASLGVTAAVHAATSLRSAEPPAAPASPPTSHGAALPPRPIALPPATAVRADMLDVIAARRSKRRFATTPLPLETLAGALVAMTARSEPILSTAVRVDVVIHAVAGIAPGAYRYEPARHALVPRRAPADLRAAARSAALDQDVIGDAAAVFVLSMDRAVFAADPLGPARGYRHAFLEAGLVGERIYLDAVARGLGACAVGAFYDDEASRLVGVDPAREWVIHFAALGIPSD